MEVISTIDLGFARQVGDVTYRWESIERVDESDEVVDIGKGWTLRRWSSARFTAPAGSGLPEFVAKVEVEEFAHGLRVGVTEVSVTGGAGRRLRPSELRALAEVLPSIATPALLYGSSATWSSQLAGDRAELAASWSETRVNLVKALRAASRVPARTQMEHEDEVLHLWETEFKPQGVRQDDAAAALGLAYSSFRTYLTRARARRKR